MTRLLFGSMLLAIGMALSTLAVPGHSGASPVTHTVNVGEDAVTGKGFFQPSPLSINVGDTVEWKFVGQLVHSASSDESGVFDSGYMPPGSTFSFTFSDVGEYAYYCLLHGAPGGVGHSGSITVLAPPTSTPTGTPTSTPSATPTPQQTPTVGATRTVDPPASPEATTTPGVPCLRRWQKWQIILGILRGWGAQPGSWYYSAYFDLDDNGIIGWGDLRLALRIPVCRRF
jgi:plastocyanin